MWNGFLEAIAWLKWHGFKVAAVTNQSGVARGFLTEDTVRKLHDWMMVKSKSEVV